jgi:hypothetical protein
MPVLYKIFIFGAFLASIHSCVDTNAAHKRMDESATFVMPAAPSNYWYQGKAELAAYDVEQERYGEMRKAEQVNVFVTEDFSAKKQVKLDDAAAAGADRVPVLKLNSIRRFNTGIYDYSVMQSVFSPFAGGSALKTTLTVQDWCGHVFAQCNNKGAGNWDHLLYSYFESEGDQRSNLSADYLEDELWTLVRLDPMAIKTGAVKIVPSELHARFRHQPLKAENATISVNRNGDKLTLSVRYDALKRALDIVCEGQAPWRILGWEETNAGKVASKGTLKAMRMGAYWGEHDNAFEHLRDSLRLR